jgi:ribosome-associated protein
MIQITPTLAIDEKDLQEDFIRASGPGGQHVNKASTAVQLRFDARQADLPEAVRDRLRQLAGKRMTDDGILVIKARSSRSQDQNRQEARNRLIALLRRAARPLRKPRRKTKPSRAAHERRLNQKHHRSKIKQRRRFDSRRDDEY